MPAIGSKLKPKLIDAAVMLFGKWGYQGVSTRSVARTVGCMEAAIYRLFKSKRGLYLEALNLVTDRVKKGMGEFALGLYQSQASKEPVNIARQAVGAWYKSIDQDGARLLQHVIWTDEKRRPAAESALDSLTTILAEKVRFSNRESEAKRAKTRAEMLTMFLIQFKSNYSGPAELEFRQVERYLDEFLRLDKEP